MNAVGNWGIRFERQKKNHQNELLKMHTVTLTETIITKITVGVKIAINWYKNIVPSIIPKYAEDTNKQTENFYNNKLANAGDHKINMIKP